MLLFVILLLISWISWSLVSYQGVLFKVPSEFKGARPKTDNAVIFPSLFLSNKHDIYSSLRSQYLISGGMSNRIVRENMTTEVVVQSTQHLLPFYPGSGEFPTLWRQYHDQVGRSSAPVFSVNDQGLAPLPDGSTVSLLAVTYFLPQKGRENNLYPNNKAHFIYTQDMRPHPTIDTLPVSPEELFPEPDMHEDGWPEYPMPVIGLLFDVSSSHPLKHNWIQLIDPSTSAPLTGQSPGMVEQLTENLYYLRIPILIYQDKPIDFSWKVQPKLKETIRTPLQENSEFISEEAGIRIHTLIEGKFDTRFGNGLTLTTSVEDASVMSGYFTDLVLSPKDFLSVKSSTIEAKNFVFNMDLLQNGGTTIFFSGFSLFLSKFDFCVQDTEGNTLGAYSIREHGPSLLHVDLPAEELSTFSMIELGESFNIEGTLPGLPDAPSYNDQVTNNLDIVIPYYRTLESAEIEQFLNAGLQVDLIGFPRNNQPVAFSREKVTLREILIMSGKKRNADRVREPVFLWDSKKRTISYDYRRNELSLRTILEYLEK